MKVYIANVPLLNKTLVYEHSVVQDKNLTQPMQLVFSNGKNIIKLFKRLYQRGIDIYLLVHNLEQFFIKMCEFRKLEYEIISKTENTKMDALLENYSEIFHLNANFNCEAGLSNVVKRYVNLESKMKNRKLNTQDTANGVKISFRPNVYMSIKTSLTHPEVYKSKDMLCHQIVKILLEKESTQESIQNILGIDCENTIKSLLFTGIIERKGDKFYIANILK